MSAFLTAAVGALFGITTGLIVQWWKSARDELRILCDDFCSVVAESADAASQYWLSSGADIDVGLKEVRVHGFQRRLTGYSVLMLGRIHDQAIDDIENALALYFDSCTGGEFGSPDRQMSIPAAKRVQDEAGNAILEIRRGFYETVTFGEKSWRIAKRAWPLTRSK